MMRGITDKALKLLQDKPLCSNCIGRLFGMLGTGLTNLERGLSIQTILYLEAHKLLKEGNPKGEEVIKTLTENSNYKPAFKLAKDLNIPVSEPYKCYLCENILPNLQENIQPVFEVLKRYEFKTFLVGTRVEESIIEREDKLRVKHELKWGESIKSELNREIGKLIQSKMDCIEADFENPDLVVEFEIPGFKFEIKANPVFVYGRYVKRLRGIPQTKWTCKSCGGVGCEKCGYTGKMYQTSVEELISEPALKLFEASESKFHGAGREDIDATMSGEGRPFILELKGVKKRNVDLKVLEDKINQHAQGKVSVRLLSYTNKEKVRRIKALSKIVKKKYRAIVEVNGDIASEKIRSAESELKGAVIEQRTPFRVAHRRADKVREKKIYEVKIKKLDDRKLEVIVECQGGLYVKELVSGDNGRTNPNLSDLLGVEARCVQLDVLEVDLSEELVNV